MSLFALNRTFPRQEQAVEEAQNNLAEAMELFFEVADPLEMKNRLHPEIFVILVEIAVG